MRGCGRKGPLEQKDREG
ncbi:hypothetical protein [Aerococcus sp. HMSC072A12]